MFKTVSVFKLTLSDLFRATDLANCANLLKPNLFEIGLRGKASTFSKKIYKSPLADSSSIGCLKAVMSMNVHKKSTTTSFSFVTGDICMDTHIGVSFRKHRLMLRF